MTAAFRGTVTWNTTSPAVDLGSSRPGAPTRCVLQFSFSGEASQTLPSLARPLPVLMWTRTRISWPGVTARMVSSAARGKAPAGFAVWGVTMARTSRPSVIDERGVELHQLDVEFVVDVLLVVGGERACVDLIDQLLRREITGAEFGGDLFRRRRNVAEHGRGDVLPNALETGGESCLVPVGERGDADERCINAVEEGFFAGIRRARTSRRGDRER